MTTLLVLLSACFAATSSALSVPGSPSYTLNDRFRATCPADAESVKRFDPSLIPPEARGDAEDTTTWVAVYRSSNNLPSALVRDDFLGAMRIATTVQAAAPGLEVPGSSPPPPAEGDEATGAVGKGEGVRTSSPVAVARLRPSPLFPDRFVIDSMRCALRKEDRDEGCDGGSEHCEALAVCVDELLLHHLRQEPGRNFDGAIRCKATLFSGPLLRDRGFVENEDLSRDMATHISSLDGSMERYAERAVSQAAKNAWARDRALEILSLLGRLDRDEEVRNAKAVQEAEKGEDNDDNGYDPWAGSSNLFR